MSATSSATTKDVPLSEWSEKLPVWGTTSAGVLSAHPMPDYLTSVRDGSQLLPTPTHWVQGEVDLDKYLARREREKAKGRNGNGFGLPLDMALRLLPTPTVNDSKNNPPWPLSTPSELSRPSGPHLHAGDFDFGPYEPAIRRAEQVLGVPAPAPLDGDALRPEFAAWCMGFPPLWTTGLGLSRNQQLRMIGNAVAPPQASLALQLLTNTTQSG